MIKKIALAVWAAGAVWSQVPYTQITDTLPPAPQGAKVTGTLRVNWSEFNYGAYTIPQSPTIGFDSPLTASVCAGGTCGTVNLELAPTDHATGCPANCPTYKVVITNGQNSTTMYWQVPTLPSAQCASSSFCTVKEVTVALPTNPQIQINPSQISVGNSSAGQGLCNLSGITGFGFCSGGTFTLTNDGTTGTTANQLAKINSSGNAVLAGTGDTAVPVFIVVSGAGTSGSATLAVTSTANCQMDAGGAAIGHFIVASSVTGGRCQDAGASAPTSGWVIGQATTTAAANANVTVALSQGYNAAAGISGSADPGAFHSVSFSATPTLTGSSATAGTVDTFVIAQLTANITNISLATLTPGQKIIIDIQQASSGGPYTVTWGSSFVGACTISPFAGAHTRSVWFISSGPTATLDAPCEADSGPGYSTEFARSSVPTPPSGLHAIGDDSTSHIGYDCDSTGTCRVVVKELTAGSVRCAGGANTDDAACTSSQMVAATGQASASTFGVVKVDGTTITASGGVISATGGSSTVTVDLVFVPFILNTSGGNQIMCDAEGTSPALTTGFLAWVQNNTATCAFDLYLPSTYVASSLKVELFYSGPNNSNSGSGTFQLNYKTALVGTGANMGGLSYTSNTTSAIASPSADFDNLSTGLLATSLPASPAGNPVRIQLSRVAGGTADEIGVSRVHVQFQHN